MPTSTLSELHPPPASFETDTGEKRSIELELPFRWDKVFPSTGGYGRVELLIPPDFRGQRFGIYFRRLGNQAVVWVDDTVVLELGRLGNAGTNYAREPVLIEIPKTVF